MRHPVLAASFLAMAALLPSCGRKGVVLYCSTDENTAKEVVKLAEEALGIRIEAVYDTEANKTVGLVRQLFDEAAHPRCDVFWNNEVVHTARLWKKGLLEPYASPAAAEIPAQFKGPDGAWTGFAARARILIVNTDLLPDPAARPTSMWDLCDARWRGKATMAKPVTGTTLTHVAALFATFGEAEATRFLDGLKANGVGIERSNGATMRLVSDGTYAFGFTDTDDFNVALREKNFPVAAVFPDQGEGGAGTFLIPNTVCLIKGGPNPDNGRRLIDFLLSPAVERHLAASRSAQIPVRDSVERPEWVRKVGEIKTVRWDPVATGEWIDAHFGALEKREW
ncbi:MAG: extracellular solute-binding protein [Planctomycetota bacterium]